MSNIMITMTVALPGGVMVTQAQAKELKKDTIEKLSVSYTVGRNKKVIRETLNVHTRPTIPAFQSTNLSAEAYNYFQSCPIKGFKLKEWKKLPVQTRVKMHCEEYAEALGGKLADFKVFDD